MQKNTSVGVGVPMQPHQTAGVVHGPFPEDICVLVHNIAFPEKRDEALTELSKMRERSPELALVVWYSVGTVAALLQEIVSIYPLLFSPSLTLPVSNRVCNALAVLQCIASHQETRHLFIKANIPLFLYPFLNTQIKDKPYEYLRVTSLGVIGALVKTDDRDVITFLLKTEIIPFCLQIMETGTELSRTVATFILQKILQDESGLAYISATSDRVTAVNKALSSMFTKTQQPSPRLFKRIVRCYSRLFDNMNLRDFLIRMIPDNVRVPSPSYKEDNALKRWNLQLYSYYQESQSPQYFLPPSHADYPPLG
eukprot:TRINITY_DN10399_c0_g1_i1.p1 TRINITY_DN10399_c0_g1~~TRINITY_DN10399_c0_g1_i1.p1  ORF type:complete len:340 (+),score=134.61 TRINITY_DN10399_c0_g1_i1:92-1021(+)